MELNMKKIKKIRLFLEDGQAALIITHIARRYLTGFPSSLGYLLITKESAELFVDGRYFEAAEKSVTNVSVTKLERLSVQMKERMGRMNLNTILLETGITVALLNDMTKMLDGAETVASAALSSLLTELRMVKTDDEIEQVIKAQRIAEKALCEVLEFIRPGVSERDIALQLDFTMRRLGAEDISFGTIAVSGENSSLPHGVPGGRLVCDGDFVTMDFGATCNGYHSDMTRTVAVGHVTDEMNTVYHTVLSAQAAVIKVVCPGITGKSADAAARDVISRAGYGEYFTHSTGHGVGLEIHEAPGLSIYSEHRLVSGNLVTDEPGIYLPGKFGVRIEDMLLVTDDGCRNLTNAPKELLIL